MHNDQQAWSLQRTLYSFACTQHAFGELPQKTTMVIEESRKICTHSFQPTYELRKWRSSFLAIEFVYAIKTRRRFHSIKLWQDLGHYWLPSLRWKGLHFLLFRINKLNRDFFHWQFFSLVCPMRNHVTLPLSHQSLSACKHGGYRE